MKISKFLKKKDKIHDHKLFGYTMLEAIHLAGKEKTKEAQLEKLVELSLEPLGLDKTQTEVKTLRRVFDQSDSEIITYNKLLTALKDYEKKPFKNTGLPRCKQFIKQVEQKLETYKENASARDLWFANNNASPNPQKTYLTTEQYPFYNLNQDKVSEFDAESLDSSSFASSIKSYSSFSSLKSAISQNSFNLKIKSPFKAKDNEHKLHGYSLFGLMSVIPNKLPKEERLDLLIEKSLNYLYLTEDASDIIKYHKLLDALKEYQAKPYKNMCTEDCKQFIKQVEEKLEIYKQNASATDLWFANNNASSNPEKTYLTTEQYLFADLNQDKVSEFDAESLDSSSFASSIKSYSSFSSLKSAISQNSLTSEAKDQVKAEFEGYQLNAYGAFDFAKKTPETLPKKEKPALPKKPLLCHLKNNKGEFVKNDNLQNTLKHHNQVSQHQNNFADCNLKQSIKHSDYKSESTCSSGYSSCDEDSADKNSDTPSFKVRQALVEKAIGGCGLAK